MMSRGLQALFTHISITTAGMLIFFTVFVLVSLVVMKRGAAAYVPQSRLPLEPEEIIHE